ncbi:MAG: 3',5'-cyclic nucleotide phosphodiesterase, partial [Terriglobus roseus]|nr:3',5'-cyclic nucleotide phosphodiesterase [Terriglobus roseus]
FVLYHNFRHVSDVLQAVFFFLVTIGILPPYPAGSKAPDRAPSAIADLLKPTDALTLLVSAIGHDVGHPGVNNAFLVALNAPLAQLYNDRSVLESFHCAAYSQILRRHWPKTFTDTKMRKLMIEIILATDMGVHFKYMSDLGNLQEKLAHNNRASDGWSGKVLEEYRDLACGLLIKCADISNVARKFDAAAKWANILTDEFSNQGRMEARLGIPTTLFGGPPVQDDPIKLGQSQIGFMNVFARPLFEAVTDVLPAMQFAVDELAANKARWDSEIAKEKERQFKVAASNPKAPGLLRMRGIKGFDGVVGTPSPKTRSVDFFSGPAAPTTAGPAASEKSMSDPNPFASVEAQAESKRRLFNPGNIDFGSPGEGSPSMPSSRRGSADPSLTTILVTQQQQGGTPSKDGKLSKKDKKDGNVKRGAGDEQVSTQEQQMRNTASKLEKQKSPPDSQPASEKGVPVAPDENAGSVADNQAAFDRSENSAFNGANGAPGGLPGSGGNGIGVAKRGPGKKAQSMPAIDKSAPSTPQAGGTVPQQQRGGKPTKFGIGKFWKKKWRSMSGSGHDGGADEAGAGGSVVHDVKGANSARRAQQQGATGT